MAKKENADGKLPEVPNYEMPSRTPEQIEEERKGANIALAFIRQKLGIKKTPEPAPETARETFRNRVKAAIKNSGPNITTVDLSHLRTTETHCRCGVLLTEPTGKAWVGITNPPLVCKTCGDLPGSCSCNAIQRPQAKKKFIREPEVLDEPLDSSGDEDVPF